MDYDEFLDLMCCEDNKGATKEPTTELMSPTEYLISIIKDVFYLTKDYKFGNISKEQYRSKIEGYFDIELVLNKLTWTGSRVLFYDNVKSTFSKVSADTNTIQDVVKELDDVIAPFKKPLSGEVTGNYRRYAELIRLSIINGYSDNYKFIKSL